MNLTEIVEIGAVDYAVDCDKKSECSDDQGRFHVSCLIITRINRVTHA